MKTRFLMIAVIALFAFSCEQAADAGNAAQDAAGKAGDAVKDAVKSPLAAFDGSYSVNVEESKVVWVGKKVTGQHTGNISLAQGKIGITNGTIAKGTITIDMTTINVTDLEGEKKGQLEGHLKSDDFFSVEKNKTAVFNVRSAKMDGMKGVISGDLVIKGKSAPQDINVTVQKGATPSIVGEMTFDRTAYDIKYGSGKFFQDLGDKMIYDEVQLKFNLALTK